MRHLLILLLAVLSGCATLPGGDKSGMASASLGAWPAALAEERAQKLAPITSWRLNGRLGVQLENDGFSAAVVWVQNDDHFDIRLFDPIGRQVAWLQGNGKAVGLKTAEGQSFSGENPEQLLQQHLGWSIPVKSLTWWVKGLPDPNTVAWRQEFDEKGRLIALQQGGWSMRVARYQGDDILALPEITRMEQPKNSVKLKLLIKSWQ